ncbi:hypothetical protein JTB14_023047 [Gonioctena quinquepunctata]|nr:hypothetical protein JTB14_023047 [Gonioctena quinquepunctata]
MRVGSLHFAESDFLQKERLKRRTLKPKVVPWKICQNFHMKQIQDHLLESPELGKSKHLQLMRQVQTTMRQVKCFLYVRMMVMLKMHKT